MINLNPIYLTRSDLKEKSKHKSLKELNPTDLKFNFDFENSGLAIIFDDDSKEMVILKSKYNIL